jgi:hypothetical protein
LITSEPELAEQSNSFNQSEMALFSECMLKCAHIVLDTADIVRDGDFSQPWLFLGGVSHRLTAFRA